MQRTDALEASPLAPPANRSNLRQHSLPPNCPQLAYEHLYTASSTLTPGDGRKPNTKHQIKSSITRSDITCGGITVPSHHPLLQTSQESGTDSNIVAPAAITKTNTNRTSKKLPHSLKVTAKSPTSKQVIGHTFRHTTWKHHNSLFASTTKYRRGNKQR